MEDATSSSTTSLVTSSPPSRPSGSTARPTSPPTTPPAAPTGSAATFCACPDQFIPCGGLCLSFIGVTKTHAEAAAGCEAQGGHLAVPRTQEQHQCLTNMTTLDMVWLGVSDVIQEGVFVAADGGANITPESPFWAADEPPQTFAEQLDCVFMWEGEWAVDSCGSKLTSICQKPVSYLAECP